MGAGGSTLPRARKLILLRAYNARGTDQTLREQFHDISVVEASGRRVIPLQRAAGLLGLSEDAIRTSLYGLSSFGGTIPFDAWLRFLETGDLPEPVDTQSPETEQHRQWAPPDSLHEASYAKDTSAVARRLVKDCYAHDEDVMYPDVFTVLDFKAPTTSRDLVPHGGTTLSLPRRQLHRRPGAQSLWRKKETVIQERVVQYTTIDPDGTVQNLVETERSRNEIVHLECKETGEFAHRESAVIEQVETFNDEVVAEEKGNEEYLHLKSRHDEYEHLESNMPKSRTQQPQTPQQEGEIPGQVPEQQLPPETDPDARPDIWQAGDPGSGTPQYPPDENGGGHAFEGSDTHDRPQDPAPDGGWWKQGNFEPTVAEPPEGGDEEEGAELKMPEGLRVEAPAPPFPPS